MNLPKRTLFRLALVGWACCLAVAACSQEPDASGVPQEQEIARPSPAASRAEWERRAVNRPQPEYQQPPRAYRQAMTSNNPNAPRPRYVAASGDMQYSMQPRTANRGVARTSYQEPVGSAPAGQEAIGPGTMVPPPVAVGPGGEGMSAPMPMHGEMNPGPAEVGCDGGCAGGCPGGCCPGGGESYCDGCCGGCCCDWMWLRDFSVDVGVHAFKGPLDQGTNANFGVNEGFSWGGPFGSVFEMFGAQGPQSLGYQVGVNFEHSDFDGEPIGTTAFRVADRNQVFLTAGLFRRVECQGVQWGAVFDYLHDQYIAQADFEQIRTEISYVDPEFPDVGFWGSFHLQNSNVTVNTTVVNLQPMDMYLGFLRGRFCEGGEIRGWGGLNDRGDGLVGADVWLPMGNSMALQNGFQYVIAKEGAGAGQPNESWSLMMNLVWYPGQSVHCVAADPFRPLLNTADNSTLIVRRRN